VFDGGERARKKNPRIFLLLAKKPRQRFFLLI
jgi:hypothetical protein